MPFLSLVFQGSLNEKRRAIVERAFRKLDADGSGVVDMTDMRMLYNARGHPKVISGEMSEDDVLRSVLSNFDVLQHDGVVYFEVCFFLWVCVCVSMCTG